MKKIKSRKRKFVMNTVASFFNQIVLIASGFVLPKAMLLAYGSEVNGLISSITQFLGFVSFMQAGVGTVAQAAWYKPLSTHDENKISEIYCSAQKFFRKIAIIFLVYTFLVAIVYPFVAKTPYDRHYTAVLVLVISINLFAQYYFGLTNTLLINAAQRAYVPLILQSVVTLLNVIISVSLMYIGSSILLVKLVSNIICLMNPIGLTWYVKRNFKINPRIQYEKEPIQQKWSGLAQHISAVVVDNTDIIILTLFTTLSEVSVYYVYFIVVNAIKQLLMSLSGGMQSLFGDMLAKEEMRELDELFELFEIAFGFIISFFFISTSCLITKFVKVYTYGINDANYNVPIFALLITIAYAIFSYRTIYYTLIKAAGHFKETQVGAIIEAVLNVVISIVLVMNYGIIGVAIGTIIAVTYRTLYCVWYLSKNILKRKPIYFLKNMVVNVLVWVICYIPCIKISMVSISFWGWVVNALEVVIVVTVIMFVIYMLVYKKQIRKYKGIFKKHMMEREKCIN